MIGSGPKAIDPVAEKNAFPGPADYSPGGSRKNSCSPTTGTLSIITGGSFSRALRKPIIATSSTPGPGEYKLPARFCDV